MTELATPTLRRIRLADMSAAERAALTGRSSTATPGIRAQARAIVDAVREGGDAALRDANRRVGGGLTEPSEAPALRVPAADLRAARDRLPSDLRDGLETMATNIERFHSVEVPPPEQWVTVEPGIDVGRVWRGLDRVAAYVPGGTAAYPSSLLMSAIPARLAGVGTYVVASPASADGQLSPALLGAAGLMEVDEFWVTGARRPSVRSPTAPNPSAAWTRSWVPATPGSRRPSSRCSTPAPSTCPRAPPRSWSWPTIRPIRSTSRPTC